MKIGKYNILHEISIKFKKEAEEMVLQQNLKCKSRIQITKKQISNIFLKLEIFKAFTFFFRIKKTENMMKVIKEKSST